MSLWMRNGALVLENGSLQTCPTCPCDDAPPPEPCVPKCSVCFGPQEWDMVINSTSTGCEACVAGTLRLKNIGDCHWAAEGMSYPQAARVEYQPTGGPGATPVWHVTLELSVCVDCDPCDAVGWPGGGICYTVLHWNVHPDSWNCCGQNTLAIADVSEGSSLDDCVNPCTFPPVITLVPIGPCCGGPPLGPCELCPDGVPEVWDVQVDAVSTGCDMCVMGTVSVARVSPCVWHWGEGYIPSAGLWSREVLLQIFQNVGTLEYIVRLDVRLVYERDEGVPAPCESAVPGFNYVYQELTWYLPMPLEDLPCCEEINFGAPTTTFSSITASCSVGPVIATPVGACA